MKYCGDWIRMNSAPHLFIKVLYEIGFIGIKQNQEVVYRSNGSKAGEMPALSSNSIIKIHPCFKPALDLQESIITNLNDVALQHHGLLIDIPESHMLDQYMDDLNSLYEAIDAIPYGHEGEKDFEKFVGDIIKLCFFRPLINTQEQIRNIDNTIRRDWVSANVAQTGFWSIMRDLYDANQVIWECKNYEDLKSSDFQQISYYLNQAAGRLGIICFRGEPKQPHYYDHIKRIYADKKSIVLLLSDSDFKVFLRQARSGKVKDSHIQDRYDSTIRAIS